MSREGLRKLLSDPARAGVFRAPAATDDVLRAAADLGFAVFPVDVATVTDKQGLLSALAAGLDFPDWFGQNWDALEDCLTDLSWWPAPGYVLMLHKTEGLCRHDASAARTAIEILADVSEAWRALDVSFWSLIDGVPSDWAKPEAFP